MGVFNMSSAAFPALKESGAGAIINISMTLHYGATWFQAHASAAKAAIDSLTRWGGGFVCIRDVNDVRRGKFRDYYDRMYLCVSWFQWPTHKIREQRDFRLVATALECLFEATSWHARRYRILCSRARVKPHPGSRGFVQVWGGGGASSLTPPFSGTPNRQQYVSTASRCLRSDFKRHSYVPRRSHAYVRVRHSPTPQACKIDGVKY